MKTLMLLPQTGNRVPFFASHEAVHEISEPLFPVTGTYAPAPRALLLPPETTSGARFFYETNEKTTIWSKWDGTPRHAKIKGTLYYKFSQNTNKMYCYFIS